MHESVKVALQYLMEKAQKRAAWRKEVLVLPEIPLPPESAGPRPKRLTQHWAPRPEDRWIFGLPRERQMLLWKEPERRFGLLVPGGPRRLRDMHRPKSHTAAASRAASEAPDLEGMDSVDRAAVLAVLEEDRVQKGTDEATQKLLLEE